MNLINNRYHIIKELGRGGMGGVYLVEDILKDKRKIALKRILPERDDIGFIEYFKHEFEALTRLNHPNIARVYDFGAEEEEGKYFFTQEYLRGSDLYDATEDIREEDLYNLIIQIARALEYIHFRGIIHYDIKPANILVVGDTERYIKLIDFGLSEFGFNIEGSLTKGTVHYMSPEVREGRDVDLRSDLYSLGITLFEVTTRRLPIELQKTKIKQEEDKTPPLPPDPPP